MPELPVPSSSRAPVTNATSQPLKLIAVPHRQPPAPSAKPSSPSRAGFRERYDEIEAYRAVLVARLASLGEAGQRHPGTQRAFTLLNVTFRRSKLAQRLAILQAAAWLIDVLEKLPAII
jgi:hypothetical protein